jgi:hypothetical protein
LTAHATALDREAEAVESLASRWPGAESHCRQGAFRALAGGLLRAGVSRPDAERLVAALCERTGDDEADKRVRLVADTEGKLREGGRVSGWPSLIKALGDDGEAVVGRFKQLLGIDARTVAAVYDYQDEAGCLRFQTVRYDPKDFRQRRPDGNGGWVWDLKGVERLLYRLPELLAADPSEPVYVLEGEKDADRLRELGLVATTNPMGAGKWLPSFSNVLSGRHVVVLPDNDGAGRDHARQVAQSLTGVAASVKVLELPGLPEAGDVSDWLAGGGTADELRRLAADAPPCHATAPAVVAATRADPPWPKPLATEAFHGLAGEIVRELEPATEADPAALLLQLLVGFGNVIGRAAHFRVESDCHFTNECLVLVGKSSKSRKGTSYGRIRDLLSAADADWVRDREQTGLSSAEGLIWAVRDPIMKMERIKDQGQVRYEQVEADPGVTDKRLFVVEPEYANVLTGRLEIELPKGSGPRLR